MENYYDMLQVSSKAEQLIINKAYRLLAAYYHPDNKQTGNEEKFKQVIKAYEVLSDPAKRYQYNLELSGNISKPAAAATGAFKPQAGNLNGGGTKPSSSPANGLEGEGQRSERELRKILLLALYDVRRNNPHNPDISVLVLSELIGVPLSHLEFSKWYLKEKKFIKVSESADYSITIDGVDYVENELLSAEPGQPRLYLPPGGRPAK
jgi:curved DNA-binding protein CbpA